MLRECLLWLPVEPLDRLEQGLESLADFGFIPFSRVSLGTKDCLVQSARDAGNGLIHQHLPKGEGWGAFHFFL